MRNVLVPESSKLVRERARAMRSSLTPSEEALWRSIRGRRLGVQFRRQVPLGRFIADFAALPQRLVVEVDGGYHARRRGADARSDEALRRMGFRVLRLEAALVMRELPVALERIRQALAESL